MDSQVLQITQQALWLVLILAGPPVVVAALVGILIAFVQAVTQLQEQTFQYAAKFFAIVLTIFVTASMMGSSLYSYTDKIFSDFPIIVDY
ncbi:MAG: type III secretion system export apparatus subunit SctS [Granulosicoccus sp.]